MRIWRKWGRQRVKNSRGSHWVGYLSQKCEVPSRYISKEQRYRTWLVPCLSSLGMTDMGKGEGGRGTCIEVLHDAREEFSRLCSNGNFYFEPWNRIGDRLTSQRRWRSKLRILPSSLSSSLFLRRGRKIDLPLSCDERGTCFFPRREGDPVRIRKRREINKWSCGRAWKPHPKIDFQTSRIERDKMCPTWKRDSFW